ncbi:helix-turn-helix transcriptional regulator [Paenibacillus campi]|uniref:helix-turn-helix domain-containing protein n=1 Tax=Paenibacillus campi TaxID=3106031 RepID=UPI002AFF62BF|nr:helix-turn-helix transcriptional regulator [Paenibacillus sp. SGZ-1014]
MPETIVLKSLTGKIIKSLRIKNDMNQEDLAFECNVDRSYISMLERGLNEPSLTKIFEISKALNITPSQFVKMVEIEYERMENLE